MRIILESEEIKLSAEQLDRIFKINLGVDLSQVDGQDPIEYDLFLTCLRKEFNVDKWEIIKVRNSQLLMCSPITR